MGVNHVSVLEGPALQFLAVRSGGIYVDATFGAGGHTRSILSELGAGRLIAIDADPKAAQRAAAIGDPRLLFVHSNFRSITSVLDRCAIESVDGVLFDLGVSSMQLDDAERGFSLGRPATLDMRMDPGVGRSAYDILATASETELADIFYYYGEERSARRIARAVVARRSSGSLPSTTSEFAQLVAGVARRAKRQRIHPATRVFQALRIAVNDELDALREGLNGAVGRLRRSTGRIVAISFHSLEDRIVKQTFRDDERLEVLTRRPIAPDRAEVAANPRARSGKLRAAERKAG